MSGIFDMMKPNLESGNAEKPRWSSPLSRWRHRTRCAKQGRPHPGHAEGIRSAVQAEMARAKEGRQKVMAPGESESKRKRKRAKAKEMKAEGRVYSEFYYKEKAEAARKKKEAEDKKWRDEHIYHHKPDKKK